MAAGAGSPCGACKFLRRKCASDCIFAPYFCSEQGPARFAAIHKVFGASNVSKLLLHLPVHERCEAVVTIAYEAQARIRDPVYGCVAHIFALQQQVAYLQAQLMQVKGQLANKNMENQWTTTTTLEGNNQNYLAGIQAGVFQTQSGVTNNSSNYMNNNNPISSPQSSLDSVDHHQNVTNDVGMMVMAMQDYGGVIQPKTEGIIGKKRSLDDMGELQELALRMMRN
ncbi:LOB domain-containing protein 16 [Beta vulgaris subsp. vulgaris]|uniref:LOB domain-containing protein 16 n=1 Tax=Beta vulgaris subsp. vulgaris TaxID=3555 RepID=UPI0020370BAF|nr:LOB domain-containing protein 16 [Beta vulgaris subsp. vulgaris]